MSSVNIMPNYLGKGKEIDRNKIYINVCLYMAILTCPIFPVVAESSKARLGFEVAIVGVKYEKDRPGYSP